MLNKITKVALVVTMLLTATILPYKTYALEDSPLMTVSPAKEEFDLKAGEQHKDSITISNNSTEDVEIKMYTAPYSITPDGEQDFETKTADTELSEWFTFYDFQGDFYRTIHAGESRTFNYIVEAPECAKGGIQHAAVFFETAPDANDEVVRMGAVFSVHVTANEKAKSCHNTDNSFLGFVKDNMPIVISGVVLIVIVLGIFLLARSKY